MKWCLACGAVQWGWSSCAACGDEYRIDPLGFRDLYKAYARQLLRFVRRVAADRGLPESVADTEGIVHDTFVVLLSASGQPIRNPAAWLFTVARNQLSKAAADQRRIAPGDPADHLDDRAVWATIASPPADAEDILAAREVMHEIAGLHGHQKIATYLRQVQGWSLAEISAYLNCTASTAGVHVHRGTKEVRSHLSRRGYARPAMRAPYRRRTWSYAACAVLGAAAVVPLVIAAHARGVPWWPAVAEAAIVAVLSVLVLAVPVVLVAAVRWWRREEIGWRLRAEAAARRRQRWFNRWLRTGQALDPPGRSRRP